LPQDAVPPERTRYGEFFEIRASLAGPNGKILKVKTVWIEEFGTGISRFITLYPD
jgi:uncharacterized protein DUF6883